MFESLYILSDIQAKRSRLEDRSSRDSALLARRHTLCTFKMNFPRQWKWRSLALALALVHAASQVLDVAEAKRQACPFSNPAMHPKHETFRELDFVWQIPPRPKGVLLLLHGMNQDPFAFFDQGRGCELCYGLTERRTAVLDALKERFAVLAPKSISKIWNPWPLDTDDMEWVTQLVKSWSYRHDLEHLPLVGWGHSYGGWMLTGLTFRLQFQKIVLMCSEGVLDAVQLASPGQFPPTLFVYMLNDDPLTTVTTQASVLQAAGILEKRGVLVKDLVVLHKALTPNFLAERIKFHCMTEDLSRKIYDAFKSDGTWLDDDDYLSRKSLHLFDWESVMVEWNVVERNGSMYLHDDVREELEVAQGWHSFTMEANEEIFRWLDLGGLPTLSALS